MRSRTIGWLIAATLVTPACHKMVPLTWTELQTLRPARVYVTQDDRSVVELTGAQVFGDTVVGYVAGEFRELPTASLQRVTMRRPDRAKTIALVAASIGVAAGVGILISGLGDPSATQFLDCADVPDDPRCQGMGP